jgi:hypothetical protein
MGNTPLFPEEEVFAKRTFEEKLSFRQSSLILGFSYRKGADNSEVRKLGHERSESITLSLKRVFHDENGLV